MTAPLVALAVIAAVVGLVVVGVRGRGEWALVTTTRPSVSVSRTRHTDRPPADQIERLVRTAREAIEVFRGAAR